MDTQEPNSGKKNRLRKAFNYNESSSVDQVNDPIASPSQVNSLTFEKRELSYSTTISFRVETQLAERLDRVARELRWSKSEILVELLKRSIPDLEKQHGIGE